MLWGVVKSREHKVVYGNMSLVHCSVNSFIETKVKGTDSFHMSAYSSEVKETLEHLMKYGRLKNPKAHHVLLICCNTSALERNISPCVSVLLAMTANEPTRLLSHTHTHTHTHTTHTHTSQ